MKNLTLSLPEDLLEKSRAYAEQHGTSLNEFIRELLRRHVLRQSDSPVDRLLRNMEKFSVDTSSWKWKRDELYDRRYFD